MTTLAFTWNSLMHHKISTSISKLLLSVALVVLLCGSALRAQSGIDLRARISTGQFNPYKVAIADLDIVGDSTPEAINLASEIKKVITDDLDFHVFFDTVGAKQFYLDVWEIKEITPIVWYRMGAEYLVSGSVKLDGDNVEVEYRIHELFQDGGTNQLKWGTLKANKSAQRLLAHMVADKVVEQVAAEKPFFTTRIAYISKATGHEEVYICDYDGANPIRLTADKSLDLSPCWDRKGEKLLYTSYKRGKQQIWEHDVPSGQERLITNFPLSNSAPAISPDNKEILASLSFEGNAELYVLNRDGKIKRRLTRIPSIEVGASWSPSGNLIAFSSDRSGSPQIYLMDSEGLNVQRLTFEGSCNDSPDFSPLGSSVAFVTRDERGDFQIATIDVTGENLVVIMQNGSNEDPHWSPDGWHFVFSKRVGSDKNIYIMDRFGKRVKKITSDNKSFSPAWGPITK
jgi:TolB protein